MTTFRDIATDAVRYWEWRRLIYNGVLVLITVGGFLLLMPRSLQTFEAKTVTGVLVLALAANVAYSAAYIPDLLAQRSSFREQWQRWRWILFFIGTALAAAIAVPTVIVCFAAPFSH